MTSTDIITKIIATTRTPEDIRKVSARITRALRKQGLLK